MDEPPNGGKRFFDRVVVKVLVAEFVARHHGRDVSVNDAPDHHTVRIIADDRGILPREFLQNVPEPRTYRDMLQCRIAVARRIAPGQATGGANWIGTARKMKRGDL